MTMTKKVSGTILGTFAVMSMTNVATAAPNESTGLSLPVVPAFTAELPILFGSVHADCKPINIGTDGWSCKKTGTGVYKITLKPSLPRAPVCQAAATGLDKSEADDDNVLTTYNVTRKGFMVESTDVSGNGSGGWAPQDTSFNFICVWMP